MNEELVGQCNSPQCRKKKRSALYYNPAKDVWICFRCKEAGKGRPDNILSITKIYNLSLVPVRTQEGRLQQPPPVYQNLSQTSRSYLIEDRGIEPYLIDHLPIYETDEGLLFFFPEDPGGYWQERRWKTGLEVMRYRNPTTAPRKPRSGMTYVLRTRPEDREVFVVEGILDALTLAPLGNVAATIGSAPNDYQTSNLRYEHGFDKLTWIPDGDISSVLSIKEYFRAKNRCDRTIRLPTNHDPSSYGLGRLMKRILT